MTPGSTRIKALHKKAVRTERVAASDVVLAVRRREHHDRDVGRARVLPNTTQYFPAVHPGHLEIEEDDARRRIWSGRPAGFQSERLQSLQSIAGNCDANIEAGPIECAKRNFYLVAVVVNE